MLKRIDEAENIIEKIPKGKITIPVEMIEYNNQKKKLKFLLIILINISLFVEVQDQGNQHF